MSKREIHFIIPSFTEVTQTRSHLAAFATLGLRRRYEPVALVGRCCRSAFPFSKYPNFHDFCKDNLVAFRKGLDYATGPLIRIAPKTLLTSGLKKNPGLSSRRRDLHRPLRRRERDAAQSKSRCTPRTVIGELFFFEE